MRSFSPFRFVVLLFVGMSGSYLVLPSHAVAQKADAAPPSSHQADALVAQALHSLQQGDQNTARQLLLHAIAVSPTHPAANNILGKLYFEEHRYPEAMERFEAVLATNLRDADARRGEVSAAVALALQVRSESPAAALACLQHARENLPDDPTLLTDLGIQAQAMKQLPLANESLNAALKLKPDDLTALYALARVETDQMHSESAEQHFRAYLAARPGDATAHYGLGHLFAMQLKTEEAVKEFKRSIELQPVQTESYYALGQIALDGQHDAEAEPLFRKVLARDPNHGGALTGMGILSYRAKHYAEAESYLAKAVANAPDYQQAHFYYSLALAHVGKKAEAEQQLKIAASLQQKPGMPMAASNPR